MIIEESVMIHAPVDKVWMIFTDLICWKDWNTVVKNVRSDKKVLTEGNNFMCHFYPFLFSVGMNIEVEKILPYNLIVWSTKKKGLSAHHEFCFHGFEKAVLVTSKETFSGLLTKGSGFLLPLKKMRSLTRIFLKDLKKASES